jgi:hypothetical protein
MEKRKLRSFTEISFTIKTTEDKVSHPRHERQVISNVLLAEFSYRMLGLDCSVLVVFSIFHGLPF